MTEVNGVELGFDPQWVKEELEKREWSEFWQDPDQEVRSLYLGTVFMLAPSGKYYTPFAHSNVEDCEKCDGQGTHGIRLCDICDGGGSRSIRELAQARGETIEEAKAFLLKAGWKIHGNSFICAFCQGRGIVGKVCKLCNGLGSREMYLDSLWREVCNSLYDSHGFSVENGEGDPCDIFATQCRDKVVETILCICFRWFNDGWYTSAWPLRYLGRGLEATSAGRVISNGLARAQQGTVDVWAAYVPDDDLFSIQEGRKEPPSPSQELYFNIKKGS